MRDFAELDAVEKKAKAKNALPASVETRNINDALEIKNQEAVCQGSPQTNKQRPFISWRILAVRRQTPVYGFILGRASSSSAACCCCRSNKERCCCAAVPPTSRTFSSSDSSNCKSRGKYLLLRSHDDDDEARDDSSLCHNKHVMHGRQG